jgi:hypothetical protein
MSIKTTITDNSTASVTVAGKTLTRRTAGGQVIYDGIVSSGSGGSGIVGGGTSPGGVNRYAVTAGGLSSFGGNHNLSSLGTGITVPPGTSTVLILGAEMPDYSNFPTGASIPQNTGILAWQHSAYRVIASVNGHQSRVYWGMGPAATGGGQVDDKIYVACSPTNIVTSLVLMFI